jgi:hypothetical protein
VLLLCQALHISWPIRLLFGLVGDEEVDDVGAVCVRLCVQRDGMVGLAWR